ncbi:MAG: DUF3857 domain-containing protein, partial [Bacteroidota bacterium]
SVVRSYEKVYRATSTRQATLYVRKVVTILDPDHGNANRLVVFYDDNSKIAHFKATLFDGLGDKIRSAKKSEIEDIRATGSGTFYDDSRVQTTTVTHSSYPYTVEFEYEKKLSNFGIVEFPQWMPMSYNESVQEASFSAEVPMDNELLFRSNELPEPKVKSADGARVYQWSVENLPARSYEAFAPPSSQTLPYVRTVLKHFDVGDYTGSMASWNDFGLFMGKLIEGRDELPDDLCSLVHESTDGLGSEREKINALYRLLQERTRYVGVQLGIGGWQPFSATYVEENRYGDCKALSNYLGAMLAEVNIDSYPVLIDWNDRSFYPVEEDFTTSAFNHMVLYVPSEDMYLECTSNVNPLGYLGDGKGDRNVLWVTPEGGKLMRTPAIAPADNGYVRTVNVAIKEDGGARFQLQAGFYGASQESIRHLHHGEKDQTKQLEWLNRYNLLPDVSGNGYSLICNPDEPVANLVYTTEVPSYARKLGQRFFVPLNKYFRYDQVPDKLSERQFPIRHRAAKFFVDTVHLKLPQDMEIESLGEAETTIKHPAGEYRAVVNTSDEGKLTWVRTLKLVPVDLPAEAYSDFRQFFVDVAKADRRQVVIRKKRTK